MENIIYFELFIFGLINCFMFVGLNFRKFFFVDLYLLCLKYCLVIVVLFFEMCGRVFFMKDFINLFLIIYIVFVI